MLFLIWGYLMLSTSVPRQFTTVGTAVQMKKWYWPRIKRMEWRGVMGTSYILVDPGFSGRRRHYCAHSAPGSTTAGISDEVTLLIKSRGGRLCCSTIYFMISCASATTLARPGNSYEKCL